MARRVFFSFHFDRDVVRVSQVRNSWVVRNKGEASPFLDAAAWEKVKAKGEQATKNWINAQLAGTSVTVVLIGSQTAQRPFVRYEIEQSHIQKKGLLGVYIHSLPNFLGMSDRMGRNPFSDFSFMRGTNKVYLSDLYKTYDWKLDGGYYNIGKWIEEAVANAGR
jgi:antiphage defense system Thoeris ThsB-like protein